jgi:hypothetical protein
MNTVSYTREHAYRREKHRREVDASSFCPYRESNPSYGYDHAFAFYHNEFRDATGSEKGHD